MQGFLHSLSPPFYFECLFSMFRLRGDSMSRPGVLLSVYALAAVLILALLQFGLAPDVRNVAYSEFKDLVNQKKITAAMVSRNYLRGFLKSQAQTKNGLIPALIYTTPRVDDPELIPFLEQNHVEIIGENENNLLRSLMSWLLPVSLFLGLWFLLIRRVGQQSMGGFMTLGKSKAKIVVQRDVGVTFNDVAGQEEAKEELEEILEFLKNPGRFTRLGAKIPKGILLVGPPGTGKTLLAKAVAGETRVPFFSINGSDFIELFVGLGAARVRDLFEQAKAVAPCVIFIDELDALGKARGLGFSGGHDEREQTLNQLLSEMDGFEGTKGVIILAATNRPEILDMALLRPGRFDRHILVDRPDLAGRVAILKIHTRHLPLAPDVDLGKIARQTAGFTGADLANLANESALLAGRKNKVRIGPRELEEATDRVIAGLEKKNRHLNEREKKIVAYHETGHALIAAARETAEPVHKISIVPRGIAALGFTLQVPTEDRYLLSQTELLERIDVLLGGRAAEELIFNDVTTGSHNDLQKATEIARNMIAIYGMNKILGHVTYEQPVAPFLQPGANAPAKEMSEQTSQLIDEQVRELIEHRMSEVHRYLEGKKELLHRVAGRLLEKETLEEEEFKTLLIPLPGGAR
jgi:cell division protease FtsH